MSLVKRVLVVTALPMATVMLVSGCGEKDIPYIIDADELIRYVTEDESARELFRTTGLINSDSYRFSFDNGLLRDSLLSHKRSIETFMVPLDASQDQIYVDHGNPLGRVREALVRVQDRLTIQVSRTYGDTILYDTTEMSLERFGFFLKLGADSRAYVGWVLWGFNGVGSVAPPLGVLLAGSSGSQFRGDLGLYPDEPLSRASYIPRVSYLRLTEIDTVVQGSRLLVTASKASELPPTFQLVADYGADGPFTRAMHRYDAINYIDSLSYQTRSGNPRLYNLVFIQTLAGQAFPNRGGFVVPYRW